MVYTALLEAAQRVALKASHLRDSLHQVLSVMQCINSAVAFDVFVNAVTVVASAANVHKASSVTV